MITYYAEKIKVNYKTEITNYVIKEMRTKRECAGHDKTATRLV